MGVFVLDPGYFFIVILFLHGIQLRKGLELLRDYVTLFQYLILDAFILVHLQILYCLIDELWRQMLSDFGIFLQKPLNSQLALKIFCLDCFHLVPP